MARAYKLGATRRAVNAVVAAMTRHGLGSKSAYLLTTTGCRSGQPRTTPVIPVESDGHRYVVSPYGNVAWVHNARSSGQLSLSRGKHTETFHAEPVDADEAGPVLRLYLSHARVTAPFFDARRGDPVEAFVAEAAQHPVFRLSSL